jgi:uncharacterized protein (UPF0333 family)
MIKKTYVFKIIITGIVLLLIIAGTYYIQFQSKSLTSKEEAVETNTGKNNKSANIGIEENRESLKSENQHSSNTNETDLDGKKILNKNEIVQPSSSNENQTDRANQETNKSIYPGDFVNDFKGFTEDIESDELSTVNAIMASITANVILNFSDQFDLIEVSEVLKTQEKVEKQLDDVSPIYFGNSKSGKRIIAIGSLGSMDWVNAYTDVIEELSGKSDEANLLKDILENLDSHIVFDVYVDSTGNNINELGSLYTVSGENFSKGMTLAELNNTKLNELVHTYNRSSEWSDNELNVGKLYFFDSALNADHLAFNIDEEYVFLRNSNQSLIEWVKKILAAEELEH